MPSAHLKSKIFWCSWLLLAAVPAAIWIVDAVRMPAASRALLFDSLDAIPKKRVGLLLGCVPRLADGRTNLYLTHRVRAAAKLYAAGKIEYVLASGDADHDGQDEPAAMKAWLIELGVPEDRIVVDAFGLRTLDSVLRAKLVFGLVDFTLISQRFHNQRAAYIARSAGLSVVGFNAPDPAASFDKMQVREPFARLLAVLDARVLRTQPRIVGARVQVGK